MSKKVKDTGKGDCFEIAGKMMFNYVIHLNLGRSKSSFKFMDEILHFSGDPKLVFGEVKYNGDMPGIKRMHHGWVEDDHYIYDFSNGHKLIYCPKHLYYKRGQVIEEPGKLEKFEYRDAVRKMHKKGYYYIANLDCKN